MSKASLKYYQNKGRKDEAGTRGGFTIVETLVAISILVIALTGPLAIIASSLKSSYFSRDEITAAYLAQEPIEFIRNVRDRNGLRETNSINWLKDVSIDPVTNNTNINSPGSNTIVLGLLRRSGNFVIERCIFTCKLKYDTSTGVYGDDNNLLPDSIFTRNIYLSQADSDLDLARELVITVVVSWNTGGISHNVTVTEHLFNWQLEIDTSTP